jgi:AmiR/NasT family two-component response regulator
MPVILLLEDDRLILHTLTSGLWNAGYEVIGAESGEYALEICGHKKPDIALLDVRMEGMNGLDVARYLQKIDVPFLFLSAYDDKEIVDHATELGALGYLVKPLDISQILPSLSTALKRAEGVRALRESEINLSTALKNSRVISVAIGLVMERYDVNAEMAFETLRGYSRSQRTKIAYIAQQLVDGESLPDLQLHLIDATTHSDTTCVTPKN